MYSNYDPTKAGQPQSPWAKPGYYDPTNAGRPQATNFTFGPSAAGFGQPPGLSSLPGFRKGGSASAAFSSTGSSSSGGITKYSGSSSSYSSIPETTSAGSFAGGLVVLALIVGVLGAIFGHAPPTGSDTTSTRNSAQSVSSALSGSDDEFRVGQYIEVDTINLNLRSGPGTNFAVVAIMPQGVRARVVSIAANGWLELDNIRGPGNQSFRGFANSKYLAELK
jgi:hypothetical protein